MTVLLTVLAAIVVAIIAAVTAQSRLRQQLAHDRALRDLDELRSLLDECAQVASRSARGFTRYGWYLTDEAREGSASESDDRLPTSPAEAVATLHREMDPVHGLYQRVVLRLGVEHPVAASFLALQAALTAAILTMDADLDVEHVPEEDLSAWEESVLALREAQFSFLARAQELVGSRLE